ncbi:DUF4263 domain-containing protein [Myxococcota bacterium]|nr:DUF4263 domain-containing protein [Myxococcota bacterium]
MYESYATEYMRKYNEELEQLGDFQFAEKIVEARIFHGMEGCVIFYIAESAMDESMNFLPQTFGGVLPLRPNGVTVSNQEKIPLFLILQSTTGNLLKVGMRKGGQKTQDRLFIPPDLPKEKLFCSWSLNPHFLNPANNGGGDLSLTGMAITPLRRKENDSYIDLPTRRYILSPFIETNSGKVFRQYTWIGAEVFFNPEKMDMGGVEAKNRASGDIKVLHFSTQLGAHKVIDKESYFSKPAISSADYLRKKCDELEALINDPQTLEPAVQKFLETDENKRMVKFDAIEIYPRAPLGNGKFYTDFACKRADGDYHLIEIEDPNKPIYTAKSCEQAAHLTHALSQVKDWLNLIETQRSFVEAQDGLKGIHKPTGEVIAGRDSHLLGKDAKERFDYDRKESKIVIRTYDMLLAQLRTLASSIEQFSASS